MSRFNCLVPVTAKPREGLKLQILGPLKSQSLQFMDPASPNGNFQWTFGTTLGGVSITGWQRFCVFPLGMVNSVPDTVPSLDAAAFAAYCVVISPNPWAVQLRIEICWLSNLKPMIGRCVEISYKSQIANRELYQTYSNLQVPIH